MDNKEAIKEFDEVLMPEVVTKFNNPRCGLFPLIREALEKQIPKKPIGRWDGNETIIECPSCGKYPFDLSEYEWARRFCGNCGQAIDWSD